MKPGGNPGVRSLAGPVQFEGWLLAASPNAGCPLQRLLTPIRKRAVKGAVFLPVQVRPGELSVHPSSYRGGREGN